MPIFVTRGGLRLIKVAVVDDEVLIRIGVRSLVNWEKTNYKMIWDAENAQKAIENCQKQLPDILLTDIKMPECDGLDLIYLLKSKYPQLCVIVLSAFEDFHYIKRAFELGAVDYILKHEMTPESLLEYFDRHTRQIKVSTEREEVHQLDAVRVIKNKIFNIALSDEELVYFNRFEGKEFICFFMHCVSKNVVVSERDEYVKECTTLSLISEISKKLFIELFMFVANHYYVGVIFSDGQDETDLINLCNEIASRLHQFINVDTRFGFGRRHVDTNEFAQSYEEAKWAIEYAQGAADATISFYEGQLQKQSNHMVAFIDEVKTLQHAAYKNDFKKIECVIIDAQKKISTMSVEHLPRVRSFLAALVCVLEKTCYGSQQFEVLFGHSKYNLYDELETLQTKGACIIFIQKLENILLEEISRVSSESDLATMIQQYLHVNAGETISLQGVADHFHLSAGYLSVMFKKKIGEGFASYVLHLRLDNAKNLLLNTDQKIGDIAAEVGYDNAYYFDRVFKKTIGMTPSQFRSVYKIR